MTKERWLFATLCAVLALGGAIYLMSVDFSRKLDTDVSSMLPQDESARSRVLRGLINERQGRSVYLAVDATSADTDTLDALRSRIQNQWEAASIVASIRYLDGQEMRDSYRLISDNKFPLLFPKWLSRKQAAYGQASEPELPFSEWAARSAIEDLDTFLESPAAMELARPELIDPLLLTVGALQSVSELDSEQGSEADPQGRLLFWARLAESPLSPNVQTALEQLVADTRNEVMAVSPNATVRYGGLARLAAASRTRIQLDIGKINALSLIAVVGVSVLLIRPIWRLALALPVVAFALLGAVAFSFLVFAAVNVVVLIIGSILIGTAIDYAFHSLFAKPESDDFPTRKLLVFACGSTIVGFSVLLFSDMALIRQIGVFVASGLACAFLGSQALPQSATGVPAGPMALTRLRVPNGPAWIVVGGMAAVALAGPIVSGGYSWKDDIRNLEAPNPAVVAEDLALRAEFGAKSDGQALLSIGTSYASALASQERTLDKIGLEGGAFAPGKLLANANDFPSLREDGGALKDLFAKLALALDEEGYDAAAFRRFFVDAEAYAGRSDKDELTEKALESLAAALEGPASAMLGSDGVEFWSLVSVNVAADRIDVAVASEADTVRLSQLSMLNESLNTLRSRLGIFGAIGLGAVALTVLVGFGLRRGGIMLLVPILAGCVSVGIAQWIFGYLNLFNLIGCFLGGAIALDYALFSVESFARGESIPYSVWLSAATTGASFLALVTSYVSAVRSLGLTVALITFATLLSLICLQTLYRQEKNLR